MDNWFSQSSVQLADAAFRVLFFFFKQKEPLPLTAVVWKVGSLQVSTKSSLSVEPSNPLGISNVCLQAQKFNIISRKKKQEASRRTSSYCSLLLKKNNNDGIKYRQNQGLLSQNQTKTTFDHQVLSPIVLIYLLSFSFREERPIGGGATTTSSEQRCRKNVGENHRDTNCRYL